MMETMDIVKKLVNRLALKGLEARPVATLSIEAQEMHEKKRKKK